MAEFPSRPASSPGNAKAWGNHTGSLKAGLLRFHRCEKENLSSPAVTTNREFRRGRVLAAHEEFLLTFRHPSACQTLGAGAGVRTKLPSWPPHAPYGRQTSSRSSFKFPDRRIIG